MQAPSSFRLLAGKLVYLTLIPALVLTVSACRAQAGEEQKPTQTTAQQEQTESVWQDEAAQTNLASLREKYFDFAQKYRLDYIPVFVEGKSPDNSAVYLEWAFAINLNRWGDEKGVMTSAYVDDMIRTYFGVKSIAHQSLWGSWNYDGKSYVAVPQEIEEEPLYSLSGSSEQQQNGHTVYTITMIKFDYLEIPPSGDDLARYRAAAVSGDLSGLTALYEEQFQFYWNEQTGDPVFLSHSYPSAQAFIANASDNVFEKIIADVDYLKAFGKQDEFDSVLQLTQADIFNLYASDDVLQWNMFREGNDWMELSVADVDAFFQQRFGVSFAPDDLIAQRGTEVLRYTDDSKQTLLLSTVNGGVYWPSAMPYTLTIDSSTPDGDLLTIHATRHYADETDGIDDTYAITLTLRITDTGYQYVSYENTLVERNGQSIETSANALETVS